MDYPKFIVSNQKEESISIQRIRFFSDYLEVAKAVMATWFSYSGPSGILGSDGKQNTA